MLKSQTRGNAGLIFRVNDAGPGYDQMRGYYVGLDTSKLYLGKMNNNWQPLAEFDLDKLDCKIVPEVWNLIRVAVEGPRIRVWFNRMHPS
ncbi:MAG: family 16 glycoside hydrolase, partial [Planctomycetota bacterium]